MKLIIRVLINAVALWAAAQLVSGIQLTSELVPLLVVAAVFGLVNAFIRPIVKLLSLPITVVTLGLFTFVINAAMLGLTAWLASDLLNVGDTLVDQAVNTLLGALVISVVSTVLSWVLPD
jgi:putative membrane protein